MKLLLTPLLLLASLCHAGLCDSGKRQSPIDITSSRVHALPVLQFDYHAVPLKLAVDDHTVRVRFGAGQALLIGKARYTLQQFHFHTPGGDRIAGQDFPMAAHLLHKSSTGQLLAVVVLLRKGADNPVLDTLLPLVPAKADGDHSPPNARIDPRQLLPAKLGYYRYSGSLTAPPCTEGFDWIVLKQPVELSERQLARYRQHFADNARAVQPLHGRVVLESP